MRLAMVLLALSSLALSGCGKSSEDNSRTASPPQAVSQVPDASQKSRGLVGAEDTRAADIRTGEAGVSLAQVDAAQASAAADEHRIIRNANLTIEIDAPSSTLGAITEAAESQGGFVVTSESKQNDGRAQSASTMKAVIRVPSARFLAALEKIKTIGGRILQENISGQDVTEEFLDVEARIRTKKALEAQFLEIMKQARQVSEALEVQTELAGVRTEIEQLAGRRRFLENQSGMSTITVTLQEPLPLVAANPSSFAGSLREAAGEGIDIAVSIVLGLVRAVLMLTPIALLIVLPLGLLLRVLVKRNISPRRTETVPAVPGDE